MAKRNPNQHDLNVLNRLIDKHGLCYILSVMSQRCENEADDAQVELDDTPRNADYAENRREIRYEVRSNRRMAKKLDSASLLADDLAL